MSDKADLMMKAKDHSDKIAKAIDEYIDSIKKITMGIDDGEAAMASYCAWVICYGIKKQSKHYWQYIRNGSCKI